MLLFPKQTLRSAELLQRHIKQQQRVKTNMKRLNGHKVRQNYHNETVKTVSTKVRKATTKTYKTAKKRRKRLQIMRKI